MDTHCDEVSLSVWLITRGYRGQMAIRDAHSKVIEYTLGQL